MYLEILLLKEVIHDEVPFDKIRLESKQNEVLRRRNQNLRLEKLLRVTMNPDLPRAST